MVVLERPNIKGRIFKGSSYLVLYNVKKIKNKKTIPRIVT